MRIYIQPEVQDFGTLAELTQSFDFNGPEDGAMKLELVIPHHS